MHPWCVCGVRWRTRHTECETAQCFSLQLSICVLTDSLVYLPSDYIQQYAEWDAVRCLGGLRKNSRCDCTGIRTVSRPGHNRPHPTADEKVFWPRV